MDKPTYKNLLDAGVHFGHLKKKWNPKMSPYIFMERKGIHIIDLNRTSECLDTATDALRQIAKSGKKVLFVAIDVITSFSGIYASLYPDLYNDDENSLDSNDYLCNFANWLNNNNYGSIYDHSMLFTSYDMDDGNTKGMTYQSGMCNNYFSSSIVELDEFEYHSSDVEYTATHLLAHSLGSQHDFDTTCAENSGMLYSSISIC